MGFSVSASAAIVCLAAFLAFGSAYTATANGFDRVTSAQQASTDHALAQANTALRIDNAAYASGTLSVNVTNTGTTSLAVSRTDVLVDNNLPANRTTRVDGDAATNVWLPGETLHVTTQVASQPSRVKVVAGNGVAVEEAV